jgi:hypothetical protein
MIGAIKLSFSNAAVDANAAGPKVQRVDACRMSPVCLHRATEVE